MGDRGQYSAGGQYISPMNANNNNMNESFRARTASPVIYMSTSPASTVMGPISDMSSAQKVMPIVQDPGQMH